MPAYLSEGSTRPYFRETSGIIVNKYGQRERIELFPVSGKIKEFHQVKSVTIGTAPLRVVESESGSEQRAYFLRRGSYCEIVRGANGDEHLQCQRGKWTIRKLPKKHRK